MMLMLLFRNQLEDHCLRTLGNSEKVGGKMSCSVNFVMGWLQTLQPVAELGFREKPYR
jgi:hypothetical protein